MTVHNLVTWLRKSAEYDTDARNASWALESANALESLLEANADLIAQYEKSGDFVMGGALTNGPFLRIREILTRDY